MKFIFLLILFPLNAFCQYHYALHGKTPDFFNNKKLYLTIYDNYSNDKFKTIDSVIVQDNTFSFSGNLHKINEMAELSYKYNGTYSKRIVIDSGYSSIIIQPLPPNYIYYNNKISIIMVEKSLSNYILKRMDSIHEAYMSLYGYYTDSSKRFRVLSLEKTLQCQKQQRETLNQYNNVYFSLIYLYQLSYARESPDSIVKSFTLLSENLKDSKLGQELYKKMTNIISVRNSVRANNEMPFFSVKTNTGNWFNNKTLLGNPYLVVFSATWCIPCHEDLPTVLSLYNRYKSKGLKVVYFNLDDDHLAWEKDIKKNDLKWINVSEGVKWANSNIAKSFNVESVPLYILVNKNGTIVFNSDNCDGNRLKALEDHMEKITGNQAIKIDKKDDSGKIR